MTNIGATAGDEMCNLYLMYYNEDETHDYIGKKHALKKYDQFALNTSCFWARGSIRSNITSVVQFYEFFVTIIINN